MNDLYECKKCNFKCNKITDYNRHINTQKHKYKQLECDKTWVCDCGKRYKYSSGYYRHKKQCNSSIIINNNTNTNDVDNETTYKNMFLAMVNENKELHNQINELIPKIGSNNNNTIKQKLNINIFLNEQCKDALTMNEFIDKIKISLDDLLLTKEKGITEGVSNIFIENMNKLSLYERPMHCTDVKREIVYIKSDDDNNLGPSLWEKDSENKKLKDAINKISCAQRKKLDLWIENHPNWQNNLEEQEEYMALIKNCTDNLQENKRENKIIKKICHISQLN